MGTTLPRCCQTCIHFNSLLDSWLGWCAHPARLPETDVTPLIRGRELPCRERWSEDLWTPRPLVDVVELREWGPFADDTPLDAFPGDLIGWLLQAGEPREPDELTECEWTCDDEEEE
jgi:hypothetical protein